jgi:hypothetical protein
MKPHKRVSAVTVVSSAGGPADAFLPPTGAIIKGAGRVYRLYRTDIGEPYSFEDIDGETLIECKTFDDEPTARRWVADNIVLRSRRKGGIQ